MNIDFPQRAPASGEPEGVGVDAFVQPPKGTERKTSPAQFLARIFVRSYRLTIAPVLGMNCRHLPSCSEYAEEAFLRHGFWAGGWMALARLMRCHPWGTAGLDFVPTAPPDAARWYLPWRYGHWRGTNPTAPR